MNDMTRRSWRLASAFAAIAACVGFMALAVLQPPVVVMQLAQGGAIVLRRGGALAQWTCVAFAFLLPLAAWFAVRRADRAGVASLYVLSPLGWLPWMGLPVVLADRLPYALVAAVVPLACVPVAWTLLRATERWMAREESARRDWPTVAGILLVSTIAYAWLGNHLSARVGEHVGDEGHYLTQAQSLYEDGDLDLRNDIMEKAATKPPTRNTRRFVHISDASRGDAWYSYHSHGLSLILAPFWGWGRAFRQVLLALIAAAGNVAMFLLARRAGAGRKSATIVVAALGASYYWAMYAVRALPETLGATLLTWAVWSVLAQREYRWRTVFLCAACCSYLVVAHERFIPLSLMAFGFYGLFGLCSDERWPAKIVRLGVFTVLCALGYGLFVWSQFLLYEGGMKYSIKGGFMDFPLGMWGVVADSMGVVVVLPAFVWMAAALPVWFARGRETRAFAAMAFAIVTVCFVFNCPNRFYVGGSCVPGRYLLVIVPLLVPGAAVVYERTHRAGRAWFVFLSLLSVCLLVLVLPNLRTIGRGFILPIQNLKRSLPVLSGLYHPHASYLYMKDSTAQAATTVYVAAALGLTLLMLCVPRRRGAFAWVAVLPVVALGVVANSLQPAEWRRTPLTPTLVAKRVGGAIRSDMAIDLVGGDGNLDMAAVLRVPFPDTGTGKHRVGLTTRDLGVTRLGMLFSQPGLDENDWDGRGHRWATLTQPFTPEPGRMTLRIAGDFEGEGTLVLAVREGSRTVFELPAAADENGKVVRTFGFACKGGHGYLYILARIEGGEGTFTVSEMYWLPWSTPPALIPGLTPDPDMIVVD